MPRSIHVRLDPASEAALNLIRLNGMTDSEAVRASLEEAAERRRARSALAAEAAALAASEMDRAAVREVQEHLDELAPVWPAD